MPLEILGVVKINNLTICIFTYNREHQLLETLKKLYLQTNQNFDIYIADNHSDFEYSSIRKFLDEHFNGRYKIHIREHNVGAVKNYFKGIYETKSKWVWAIADDDIPEDNAVEKIYREINEYDDAICICATLANMPFVDHHITLNSIEEFISLYYPSYLFKSNSWHGDLIWSSNKIYRTDQIRKMIGDLVSLFSNFQFPSTLLILFALRKKLKVVYTDSRIIHYNDSGIGWNIRETILSTLQLKEIQFTRNYTFEKKLRRIVAFHISELYKLFFLIDRYDIEEEDFIWKMYMGLYKEILPFHQRLQMLFVSKVSRSKKGFCLIRYLVNKHFTKSKKRNVIKNNIKRILRRA